MAFLANQITCSMQSSLVTLQSFRIPIFIGWYIVIRTAHQQVRDQISVISTDMQVRDQILVISTDMQVRDQISVIKVGHQQGRYQISVISYLICRLETRFQLSVLICRLGTRFQLSVISSAGQVLDFSYQCWSSAGQVLDFSYQYCLGLINPQTSALKVSTLTTTPRRRSPKSLSYV